MKRWIATYLLLTLGCFSAFAQSLFFKHLGQKDGLSHPNIKALHVDKDDFLWIGTENGLNRFDGETCITYKKNSTNQLNFPGNFIVNIIEDKYGDLIIGSQNNAVKYNRKTDNFTVYRFGNDTRIPPNHYSYPFYIDKNEDLWIFLAGNVFKYDKATKTTTYITEYANGIAFSPIPFYRELKWFAANGTRGLYINATNPIKEDGLQAFFTNKINKTGFSCFIEDTYITSDTLLWLATDKGLIKLNPKSKAYTVFNNYKTNKNLYVTALAKYPNKPWLFVGTKNNGLLLFNQITGKFFEQYKHQPNNSLSISANHVRKIYIDKKQNLFVGIDGHGLDYTNLNKAIFSKHVGKEDVDNLNFENNITTILKDKKDRVWCGTKNSGLLIYNKDFTQLLRHTFKSTGIVKLIDLDGDVMLIELANGDFFKYDVKKNIFTPLKTNYASKPLIHQIIKIGDKGLYAATEFGIAKLSLESNNQLFFKMEDAFNKSLGWSNTNRIIPISDDKVLVQTNYTGIYLADLKNGSFKFQKEISRSPYLINGNITIGNKIYLATTTGLLTFNTLTNVIYNPQLIDANCVSITADQNKNFWIGTNNGLYFYDTKKQQKIHYTTANGLQSMVFNSDCFAWIGHQIAFGGINGISLFNPLQTNNEKKSPAQPKITQILVNDQPFPHLGNPSTASSITLKPNQNTLTIAFSAMDYINPKQRKIKYRMLGYDNQEVTVFGSNKIRYPNLPSGSFKFEVLDVYSKTKKTLAITVLPYWYKTIWFKILCLTTIIIVIVFVVKRRIAFIRKQFLFKQQLSESELKAIRSQMNPHFIFNVLNSIESYIMDNDKKMASRLIQKFASLSRLILENSNKSLVSADKEWKALMLYTELEAMRYNNSFSYSFIVDETLKLNKLLLPPMLIQPLIENAILHGLIVNPKPGAHLEVQLKKHEQGICITVEDNGNGLDHQPKTTTKTGVKEKSMGLASIKERIAMINAQKNNYLASFKIMPAAEGEGTFATILLPNFDNAVAL